MVEMQEYDFKMRHKPGSQMMEADLLSRQARHPDGKQDNEGVTLLLEQWFWSTATSVEGPEGRILERIRRTSGPRDNVVIKALTNKEDRWEETDGLIMWKGRIYVPRDQELRADIVQMHHDPPPLDIWANTRCTNLSPGTTGGRGF